MAQANAFDLDRFNQALFCVHQLLDDPGAMPSQKAALQAWWGRRSAKLNQQLMQRLPYATTARERLFLRLGSVLLQPQQSGIEARLIGDIEDYTNEISKRVTIERDNITGDGRLRRAGTARAVVTEQIEDLNGLVREVRSVTYAWDDIKGRARLANEEISSKIENLKRSYLADGWSSSVLSESLIELLSGLIQLDKVVAYVDGNLTTAYREDSGELWTELEQKLHGYRNIPTQVNWVPQGPLRQHISFRWIEKAKKELKENRSTLQQRMDKILQFLKYQDLEATHSLEHDRSLHQSSDKQVVLECILSERQRDSILEERSVLEMAHNDLVYIKEHSILDEYKLYTDGADQFLIDNLTKKLMVADVLPREQALSDYLDGQIQTIQDLRSNLSTVVGARSGDNAAPLTLYGQVFGKAVQYARSAQFDKARASCSEGNTELEQTVTTLDACQKQIASPLPGMARRILSVIEQEIDRLKAEKESIARVEGSIDSLERDYRRWKEEFETNLAEWNRRNQGRLLKHFRKAKASHFLQIARHALCECQTRCPDDDWVHSWANKGFITPSECAKLGETEWINQYFAARPTPEKVAS